ncbi:MAG: CAP domain-containing protein [Hyphomicrobiaceae bacterium]
MRETSRKVTWFIAAALTIFAAYVQVQLAAATTLTNAIEQEVAQRTNAYRIRQGIAALSQNEQLHNAARSFAEFMARTGEYGHRIDGKTPSQRVKEAEYQPCTVRENIGFLELGSRSSPENVAARLMAGWIASPGHRKNLDAKDITQFGIGVARISRTAPIGQRERFYAVQLMASPREQAYRFSVRNSQQQIVKYTVDGKSFDLPPNTTHTHLQCTPPLIETTSDGQLHTYNPKSGEMIEF